MAKINLPKEILQKDTFKSLPAKEKEEYINNLMNKIVQLNPSGVTISQIKDALDISSSTIWHHIEILKSIGLIRKISHGNMDVYYPFGALSPLDDIEKDKVRYSLSTAENVEGKFVVIQEKRENRLGSYTILRGIAIPVDIIDALIKNLNKAKKSAKK